MHKLLNSVPEYLFCSLFVTTITFTTRITFVIEIVIHVYIYNCWNACTCNKLMSKIGMMTIRDCLLTN